MAIGNVRDWKGMEEQVTCCICQDLFDEPKTLACFHTFCEKCIRLTIQNNSDKECSICGVKFPQDLTKIPTDSLIQHKVDIVRRRKAKKCGLCVDTHAHAVKWCIDCEDYLCEECLKQHNRLKTFLSHKTVPKELFQARSPDMVFSTTCQPEYDSCKKHKKSLDLYCTTCNILICQSCAENNHRDRQKHECHTVNILADEARNELKKLGVLLTTTLLEQVNAAVKKVENSDNEVNNEANFKREIIDTYRQFHEKLNQCEEKDLQKLENTKTALSTSLGSQKENLKSLKACLINYDEFISKVTSKERASQLLTHNNEIQKGINDLTNQVKEACQEQVCGIDQLVLISWYYPPVVLTVTLYHCVKYQPYLTFLTVL